MQGDVEADEAYVGGVRHRKPERGAAGKTIVMGMKERGGRMNIEVIPDIKSATLREAVFKNIERGSTVSIDELYSYSLLKHARYTHGMVAHGKKEYARARLTGTTRR
jgi:transposase